MNRPRECEVVVGVVVSAGSVDKGRLVVYGGWA